jgi:membrane-bound lytic murein transglycosylase A
MPFFIEANLPIESGNSVSPSRRLMIAQDTGSAIVGPARADLCWGAGDDAGRLASRIRHPGRFVMLLPRELDICLAGSEIPLPVPKPKPAALEMAKKDDKAKVELAGSGVAAVGRKMLSPLPQTKKAALEARKQDGVGAIATGGPKLLSAGKPKIIAVEVKKQSGKSKSESASADVGATATLYQQPAPSSRVQTKPSMFLSVTHARTY